MPRYPKEERSRARDNPTRDTIKSDGKIGGWELPDDILPMVGPANNKVREEWHVQTTRWWQAWRESPQATRMVTEVDWQYMLDTALLHHQMWMSGGRNSERAAEIRIRVAMFGATPMDRLKLRQEIEPPVAENYDVGTGGNVSSMNDARRDRIIAG